MVKDEREQKIVENVGLVHSVAKRFTSRGAEYDDIFQAGCLGLIKAVDNFDEEKGFQFSTYAVPVIIGEIKRIFRDGGPIKVSRSLKEQSIKVQAIREKYIKKENREPTLTELSRLADIDLESRSKVLNVLTPVMSLSSSDSDFSEWDIACDDTEALFDKIVIKELASRLSEREQLILNLRYYEGKTQCETAEILKISQVQVSRKEKQILRKLRENISEE